MAVRRAMQRACAIEHATLAILNYRYILRLQPFFEGD